MSQNRQHIIMIIIININGFADARLCSNNNKIANNFQLFKAWKYLQRWFTLYSMCNTRTYMCTCGGGGGGDGGAGGGCHSTFHTTQWIFHKLFSQTEYNSVSFWGKLYLIDLNAGLECIVECCAFCVCVYMLSPYTLYAMHMSISLSVNDNNLHFYWIKWHIYCLFCMSFIWFIQISIHWILS